MLPANKGFKKDGLACLPLIKSCMVYVFGNYHLCLVKCYKIVIFLQGAPILTTNFRMNININEIIEHFISYNISTLLVLLDQRIYKSSRLGSKGRVKTHLEIVHLSHYF